MDGRAFGVYWEFVERERRRVAELEERVQETDRRCCEAWFQVMAMGQEDATAADKEEAGALLNHTIEELEAAKIALESAQRRLPLYEQTLRQYTAT